MYRKIYSHANSIRVMMMMTLCKKIRGTTDRMELVIYSARQFGIKDMGLKTVRVRNIVWGVIRGGLRPTWSL